MQHTINGNTLTLERTFNAPRQKVWDAFADKDTFVKWWGPRGWSTEVKEFNFVGGGINHYGMKCEDETQGEWFGKYSWGKMVFSNINPIESFSYSDYFSDENGSIQEGMPAAPCTNEFLEVDGDTKIISTISYATETDLKTVIDMGMIPGITETWDRLEEVVTGQ